MNAFDKWKYDKGADDFSGIFDQNKTTQALAEEFFSYLKIIEICNQGKNGCMEQYIKYPKAKNNGQGKNGTVTTTSFYKAVLTDGSSIAILPYVGGDSNCGRIFTDKLTDSNGNWIPDGHGGYQTKETYSEQCGTMIIDANGLKGPNQLGADVYSFIITNKQIANWHTKIDSVLVDEELQYSNYEAGADFSN